MEIRHRISDNNTPTLQSESIYNQQKWNYTPLNLRQEENQNWKAKFTKLRRVLGRCKVLYVPYPCRFHLLRWIKLYKMLTLISIWRWEMSQCIKFLYYIIYIGIILQSWKTIHLLYISCKFFLTKMPNAEIGK